MQETVRETLAPKPLQIRITNLKDTGQYFTGHGWTNLLGEASVYASFEDAVRTCYRAGLVDAQLHISDGTHEFRFTVVA